MADEKTITLRVPDETRKSIRLRVAERGGSLKDYILSLVERDLEMNERLKIVGLSTFGHVDSTGMQHRTTGVCVHFDITHTNGAVSQFKAILNRDDFDKYGFVDKEPSRESIKEVVNYLLVDEPNRIQPRN